MNLQELEDDLYLDEGFDPEAAVVPDPDVWYQTSRSARMVARMPEGKTGIEALIDAQRPKPIRSDFTEWSQRMGEGHAGDYFLRCHAHQTPGLHRELSRAEFDAFRAAGGGTYMQKHYERLRAKLIPLETLDREQAGAAILEYVEATFSMPDGNVDLSEVRDVLRLLTARRRGT